MTDELKKSIKDIIEHEYGRISENVDGQLVYEMYADYRDEMDNKTAYKILISKDPQQEIEDELEECYGDERWRLEDDLFDKIIDSLTTLDDGETLFTFDDDEEQEIREYMNDCIYFDYPRDHFLNQEFCVNIMLDTGDGNYDYVLNSVYPCWYGRPEDAHDDKAAIVWLAKQQGYKKREFRKAMNKGDLANPKGFLQSMRHELANLPSHMSILTFLVKMTLRDLVKLNNLIQLQDRNGHFYDATKNPYCGYIILDRSTETGLYDPWSGGGSIFEIKLEKDVKIPIRYIRSALPDVKTPTEYSIDDVYGMCESAWRDTVKEIHAPRKIPA